MRVRRRGSKPECVIEERHGRETVVVTGRWSSAVEEVIRRSGVDALELNYARGFCEPNLDFLPNHLPIRRLQIIARTLSDLGPIERLSESLEGLMVQVAPDAALDLERFPGLTMISGPWRQLRGTIESVRKLEDVIVLHYDERDLSPFFANSHLRSVVLKEAPRLEMLDGVEQLAHLARLTVMAARRLDDLSGMSRARAPLERFELEGCDGVSDLDHVADLDDLRFLGVSDCGDIDTLMPVGRLHRLNVLHAWGTTRIRDNDLAVLLTLPELQEVRMRDRAEYLPRVDEVRRRLR